MTKKRKRTTKKQGTQKFINILNTELEKRKKDEQKKKKEERVKLENLEKEKEKDAPPKKKIEFSTKTKIKKELKERAGKHETIVSHEKTNKKAKIKKTIKIICLFIIGLILAAIIGGGIFAWTYFSTYLNEGKDIVINSTEDDFKINLVSYIYDDKGKEITQLSSGDKCEYLDYNAIPKNVVNAFVAIEDRSFWDNPGISTKGLTRVFYKYVTSKGSEVTGASTITQQLVKNTFLTQDVTIERKLKEMGIALNLVQKYPKEKIMEFYTNSVYFANNCYGIEAASLDYFDKSAKDLTLSETAYLCAIPNNPSYYDPRVDKDAAISRRDLILHDMYEMKYITKDEYNKALSDKIELTDEKEQKFKKKYEATYAIYCAVEYLMRLDNFNFRYTFNSNEDYLNYINEYNEAYAKSYDKLIHGGYKIRTSLNEKKQKYLQNAVDDSLRFSKEKKNGVYELQGAGTMIDNKTGNVIAIVGGRTQSKIKSFSLNRAFQSTRQPGSSIKPLAVYGPAVDAGIGRYSTVRAVDVATAKAHEGNISAYSYYYGSLDSALTSSNNNVAWYLMYQLGVDNCLNYLEKMEFSNITAQDHNLAAALGGLTYGVTTVEMASGFATLANEGVFNRPTCLVSFIDRNGNELYKKVGAKRVYKQSAIRELDKSLENVLRYGTAASMGWSSLSDVKAGAKTGTTDDSKDGWLCGFTPYYSLAVWVGYDQPRTLSNLYGATYPANIWKSAMSKAVKGKSSKADFNLYNLRTKTDPMKEMLSKLVSKQQSRIDDLLEASIPKELPSIPDPPKKEPVSVPQEQEEEVIDPEDELTDPVDEETEQDDQTDPTEDETGDEINDPVTENDEQNIDTTVPAQSEETVE